MYVIYFFFFSVAMSNLMKHLQAIDFVRYLYFEGPSFTLVEELNYLVSLICRQL